MIERAYKGYEAPKIKKKAFDIFMDSYLEYVGFDDVFLSFCGPQLYIPEHQNLGFCRNQYVSYILIRGLL